MTIICAHCDQRRRHEARGLCHACYEFVRWRGMLHVFSRGRRYTAKGRREYDRQRWQQRRLTSRSEA